MEIRRQIEGKLVNWQKAKRRKPLVLRGARRVDKTYLLKRSGKAIPIEVKSDENIRSRSLTLYHQQYNPPLRIRYSLKNLQMDNGLLNIPVFIAGYTQKLLGLL